MGKKKAGRPASASRRPEDRPPPVDDVIRKKLRFVRRMRVWGIWGLIGPPLVVGLIVLAHRLSDGAVGRYLLAHDPWTFRFFFTLMGVWMVGLVLLLLNRAVRCPRCGLGFRTRMDYDLTWGQTEGVSGFGANVFARRCLNCGVGEDGSVRTRDARS